MKTFHRQNLYFLIASFLVFLWTTALTLPGSINIIPLPQDVNVSHLGWILSTSYTSILFVIAIFTVVTIFRLDNLKLMFSLKYPILLAAPATGFLVGISFSFLLNKRLDEALSFSKFASMWLFFAYSPLVLGFALDRKPFSKLWANSTLNYFLGIVILIAIAYMMLIVVPPKTVLIAGLVTTTFFVLNLRQTFAYKSKCSCSTGI